MKHLGTVTLESERLILRKCVESDYEDSYKYCCSDPELCRCKGLMYIKMIKLLKDFLKKR